MATLADVLRNYAPPTDSALADPIKEHFRTLPQQLATNQQAMDNTMASMYKTDMATGQPNPNYRPEAMNEFTQMMPMVGALTAWHGTPHKILGKFDISKVGTGEGNQTFGHGMYFAENPKVAIGYRDALAVDPNFASEKLNFATLEKFAPKESKNVQKMVQMFTDGTANYNDFVRIINQEGSKPFKNALLKEEPNLFSAGNLYKVDIPDEYIPNMLDWDKPFTKDSPQQIKDALNGIIKEYPDLKEPFMKAFRENKPGNHYYSLLNDYAKTGDLVKNQKFASSVLQKAGIPGIRYLDEGSRSAGKGTSNFVVFDPSTVKILEENSKPLSRKELIEQQVNKVIE